MEDSYEYKIYIGCRDSQSRDEIIREQDLQEMVSAFFRRRETGFSMLNVTGGYRHDDGSFVTEDTLCISLIGAPDLGIVKLARSLAMIMNQESALVVRTPLKTDYR